MAEPKTPSNSAFNELRNILPHPEPPFKGKIGRTAKDSTPDFPKGVEAPEGAPNVLLILMDDVGFGASSTFGGPIETPTFQRVADNGLRYNTFHTTALCSPSRAAFITGRNHPDDFKWELYNIGEDFSQANNLAEKNPAKLKELQAAFEAEAKKYNVYPLDSSFAERANPAIRPSLTRGRSEFTYYPGMIRIPEGSAPDFKNKSWTVAAEITIPKGGASGVLATLGGRFGGWGLLMQDSKPEFAYAFSNQPEHKFRVRSDQPIPAGNHVVRIAFRYDGGGYGNGATGVLFVDEKHVGEARIPHSIAIRFSATETLDIGEDIGTPVVEDYADKMPFKFTGTLKRVVVVLEPEKLTEQEKNRLLEESAQACLAVH